MGPAGRRRILIAAMALVAAVSGGATQAQQAARSYRIGILSMGQSPQGDPLDNPYWGAMLVRLRELGHPEGSVRIDGKWAAGKAERLTALAAELVASKVDVLVTIGELALDAASRATPTIPIVMFAGDPLAYGYVQSLSHPTGNLTGLSFDGGASVWTKRLQLLKQAAPKVRRVAVLTRLNSSPFLSALTGAAKDLGIVLSSAQAQSVQDLPAAFAAIEAAQPDALFVSDSVLFFHYRQEIIRFAAKHRLPDAHGYREAVREGALMSYATDLVAAWRQVAYYVDRLLKGARPSDLPIQRPAKFDFVVNSRTARALELELPASLLLSADQVIE